MKLDTLKSFIITANIVHQNTYSYTNSVYINRRAKIEITCSLHGSFWQTAGHHISGSGCPDCKKLRTKKQQNTTISYSDDAFKGMTIPMEFVCTTHGRFTIRPDKLLSNTRGCPRCGHKKALHPVKTTLPDLIKELSIIHDNKYDYSKLTSAKIKAYSTIICPTHGEFTQKIATHKKGSGCPSCAKGGFDPNKPGFLYYLSINDGYAYKIGITNRSVEERFTIKELQNIKVIFVEEFLNGQECWDKERSILQKYKKYQYTGPDLLASGNTELFNLDIFNLP